MALRYYLCVFILLSSIATIKAEEDDTKWKQRMEAEMKRILEVVEDQKKVIRKQDSEIAALKTRVATLEAQTGGKTREEDQPGQQTSIKRTKSKANQFINTPSDNHSPSTGTFISMSLTS
jgi:aspartate-semialdehyde dehydrogenase